jgi:hypothetical protein
MSDSLQAKLGNRQKQALPQPFFSFPFDLKPIVFIASHNYSYTKLVKSKRLNPSVNLLRFMSLKITFEG